MPKYINTSNHKVYYAGGLKWFDAGETKDIVYEFSGIDNSNLSPSGDYPYLLNPTSKDKTISTDDSFTDWFTFSKGNIDFTVKGSSFTGTVTIQKKYTEDGEIIDVDSFTSDYTSYFTAAAQAHYRIGIKSGDYTSGSVYVRLDRSD